MTHRTIWRSRRAVDHRGPIEPMSPVDAEAQRITRERHPWLYQKETVRVR